MQKIIGQDYSSNPLKESPKYFENVAHTPITQLTEGQNSNQSSHLGFGSLQSQKQQGGTKH